MKPVSFRIAGGVFTIRLLPTLMTVIMVVVMVSLGTWQVERLRWKENLIATINKQMQQAPVTVDALEPADTINYRPARAQGVFLPNQIFYLSATSLTGAGGYHVLQPLRLADGSYLLVDRGWIPYDRRDKPDGFDSPSGLVTIKGILHVPTHSWAQPANRPVSNDWYWIDLSVMAQRAGISALKPYVLDADATPNLGGYPIGGQTRLNLPNNHFQYALTWYGLAFVLTNIYLIQGYRRDRKV